MFAGVDREAVVEALRSDGLVSGLMLPLAIHEEIASVAQRIEDLRRRPLPPASDDVADPRPLARELIKTLPAPEYPQQYRLAGRATTLGLVRSRDKRHCHDQAR